MNSQTETSKKIHAKHVIACMVCVLLIASSVGIGYWIGTKQNAPQATEPTGYAANPAYEYMVASAAWQMSAEAHALMMQGFYIAERTWMKWSALPKIP